jgi:hypothetical protein
MRQVPGGTARLNQHARRTCNAGLKTKTIFGEFAREQNTPELPLVKLKLSFVPDSEQAAENASALPSRPPTPACHYSTLRRGVRYPTFPAENIYPTTEHVFFMILQIL